MQRYTFPIVSLVVLITIINYFDRISISFAIEPIEGELLLNNAYFGLVAGAFGIGYLISSLFAGILVDRWGPIRVWGISAIAWSCATFLLGFASGFWSLFLLRIFLGVTEGFNSPSLLRTVSDWLSPLWRSRLISIGLLGVPIAALIGSPFITHLIDWGGWRAMFQILGAMGILWSLIWFSYFKGRKSERERIIHPRTPWHHFFTSANFLLNCFFFFTFGSVIFFGLMWLPGILQQTKGLTLGEVGYYIMIPWFVCCLFQLAGGWISDAIWAKTRSIIKARIYPMCLSFILCGTCFFLLSYQESLAMTLLLYSLGLGFVFFINPSIFALNADLFPNHPATAQSFSTCFFAVAGMISPSLSGWLSELTGNFNGMLYYIAALTLFASLTGFLTHLPRREA